MPMAGCHKSRGKYIVTGEWYTLAAIATQQTMRSEIKRLGEFFGLKTCEVKCLYDENDRETEAVVECLFKHDGMPRFLRQEIW